MCIFLRLFLSLSVNILTRILYFLRLILFLFWGVSTSQQRNREEWEDRGRALVAEYVQDFHEKTNKYNPVHLKTKREEMKRENGRMHIIRGKQEEKKQEEEEE